MRDKIFRILTEYRNTAIGNIALANIIAFNLKSLNDLTTEPLCTLLIENGEKCYREVGTICEINTESIRIGKKIYQEIKQ